MEDLLKKFQNIDLIELFDAMAEGVMGNETGTEEYTVKLAVPISIAKVVNKIADHFELSKEEIYSGMASQGLREMLRLVVKDNQPTPPESETPKKEDPMEALKSVGLDISGIMSKFDQLGELTKKLEQVAEATTHVTGMARDPAEDKKHSK